MPDALSVLPPASAVEGARVGELDDDGLVRVFEALSSTMRLRMLRQLARDAVVCACGFDVQATIGQSTVSHHLRVLREAGLVRADRSGAFIHYALERRRRAHRAGDRQPPLAARVSGPRSPVL